MVTSCVQEKVSDYNSSGFNLFFQGFICVLMLLTGSQRANCADNWPFETTSQSRPGTYFWVPGNAFDKESIDWNLEKIKAAGFGTVHIVPIYGAKGYEDRNIDYLSPKWMEMFGHLTAKAKELRLQVDMTTGTGWCFGGPNIPDPYKDTVAHWDNDKKEIELLDGMKVKRASPGAEGPMLNTFSPDAMNYYLQRFSSAFDQYTGDLPRAQYHDSYEYKGDWTVDLLEKFLEYRGYDLKPYLETFFGETSEDNWDLKARLKYDYRHTLAQLHLEYLQEWIQWSRQRGMITRNQAHGSPTNLLDSYCLADIPETEIFGSPTFPIPGFRPEDKFWRYSREINTLVTQMASSAANVGHQPGKQLVGAESFTWLRDHWRTTLGQMKLSADLFFLAGVNQMFFHGTCYTPKDAPWPGWFFYASTKADWRNSIWRDMHYLNDYIAHCQSVLQNSQPANDILVYWPIHDLWMNSERMQQKLIIHGGWLTKSSVGEMATNLRQKGFTFDYISDRLLQALSFSNGSIQAPGGKYRAIVIPVCQYIPVETLERLIQLSQAGAPVIFEKSLPSDVPGLAKLDQRREKFSITKSELKKTVQVTPEVIQLLGDYKITREAMVDSGLSFIRRKINNQYWYFIANHSANAVNQWIPLGVTVKSAIFHDPMTGKAAELADKQDNGQSYVYVQLAAGQSIILETNDMISEASCYNYLKTCGQPIALQGPWKVKFVEGKPKLPQSYTTDKLKSWTEFPDPAVEAFAGAGRYRIDFDIPDNAADDWLLDLGEVRESARVYVNGQYAGALFALPYRMNIGSFLKPEKNTLEIEVTNLTLNRIRALDKTGKNWKIMTDTNIVDINYKEFEPAKWPLEPSGLLGPVQLIPMQKRTLKKEQTVTIICPPQLHTDLGWQLAVEDLSEALTAGGYNVIRLCDSPDISKVTKAIWINPPADILDCQWKGATDEAYRIGILPPSSGNGLFVQGDVKGTMYGLYKLAEKIRLKEDFWKLQYEATPAFPVRMFSEEGQLLDLPDIGYYNKEPPYVNQQILRTEVDELKTLMRNTVKLGYNRFVLLNLGIEEYIDYKYLDKKVYPDDDPHRMRSKVFCRFLTELCDYAHSLHLGIYLQLYEIQYPDRLNELYEISLDNPAIEDVINARYKEFFERVPLDGLVITATETHWRAGYKSKNLWRTKNEEQALENAAKMMTLYYNACKAAGKESTFRMWRIANDADSFRKILAKIPDDAIACIKNTGGDYFLNFPTTDVITEGVPKESPFVILFDTFREYEGWSRLFIYMKRWEGIVRTCRDNGVMGINAWGPWAEGCIWPDFEPGYMAIYRSKSDPAKLINDYKKNDDIDYSSPIHVSWRGFWNDFRMFTRGFTPGQANVYLLGRLAWNPDLEVEQIAEDFMTLQVGKENAKFAAEALMATEDAFAEQYFGEKVETAHPCYMKWATVFTPKPQYLNEAYKKVPLATVLATNNRALDSVDKMERALKAIDPEKASDPQRYALVKDGFEKTALYLRTSYCWRECWWRMRADNDLSGDAKKENNRLLLQSKAKLKELVDQWQRWPEEAGHWRITFKYGKPVKSDPAGAYYVARDRWANVMTMDDILNN